MYNTSLYTIRQVMSVFRKMEKGRPAFLGALVCVSSANTALLESNTVRYEKTKKKAMKQYQETLDKGKEWNPKEGNVLWFDSLIEDHYMDYYKLDAIFKQQKQNDYVFLPTHTANTPLKTLFRIWKTGLLP